MNPTENTRELLEAGARLAGAGPRVTEVAGVPVAILEDGQTAEVLTEALDLARGQAPHPDRKRGIARFHDLESFIGHVLRNKTKDSTVWANVGKRSVTAIYDYHGPAGKDAGWCAHQAVYTMPYSPEWLAWQGKAGKDMSQEEFAQHLEDRMEDLTDGGKLPSPIQMLEVARNLQVFTKGQFLKQINPETGEFRLICKEEHGEGTTQVPKAFGLALRVYDAGDQYRVEARLRFRVPRGGSGPVFTYTLHRASELEADAFMDVRTAVAEKTSLPVWAGQAEEGNPSPY